MDKLIQINDFTRRSEVVRVPKSNAITLEDWAEKFNKEAPAHIHYEVEKKEEEK